MENTTAKFVYVLVGKDKFNDEFKVFGVFADKKKAISSTEMARRFGINQPFWFSIEQDQFITDGFSIIR